MRSLGSAVGVIQLAGEFLDVSRGVVRPAVGLEGAGVDAEIEQLAVFAGHDLEDQSGRTAPSGRACASLPCPSSSGWCRRPAAGRADWADTSRWRPAAAGCRCARGRSRTAPAGCSACSVCSRSGGADVLDADGLAPFEKRAGQAGPARHAGSARRRAFAVALGLRAAALRESSSLRNVLPSSAARSRAPSSRSGR